MKLEVGKKYELNDGRVMEVVEVSPQFKSATGKFVGGEGVLTWEEDGLFGEFVNLAVKREVQSA